MRAKFLQHQSRPTLLHFSSYFNHNNLGLISPHLPCVSRFNLCQHHSSFSGRSGKVQSPSTAPSSSSSVFTDPSHLALSNCLSAATSAGSKSQPLSGPSSEIGFTFFSTDCTVQFQRVKITQSQRLVTNEGLVVIDLLSQPLRVPGLPPSDLSRIDASHPAAAEFLACDDPVDFLSNTLEYSEEIWEIWQDCLVKQKKSKGKKW
ncbi:hypothetical protein HOY82DRAFT_573051, partial [Tuber indicum]